MASKPWYAWRPCCDGASAADPLFKTKVVHPCDGKEQALTKLRGRATYSLREVADVWSAQSWDVADKLRVRLPVGIDPISCRK